MARTPAYSQYLSVLRSSEGIRNGPSILHALFCSFYFSRKLHLQPITRQHKHAHVYRIVAHIVLGDFLLFLFGDSMMITTTITTKQQNQYNEWKKYIHFHVYIIALTSDAHLRHLSNGRRRNGGGGPRSQIKYWPYLFALKIYL